MRGFRAQRGRCRRLSQIAAIASAWLRRNVRQFCDGGPWCRDGAIGLGLLVASIVFVAPAMQLLNNTHRCLARSALWDSSGTDRLWLAALEQNAERMPAKLLVALGDWSYATYLTHVLVLSALGRIIHSLAPSGATSGLVLIVVGVTAANLAGAVMFRFLERRPLGCYIDSARRHSRGRSGSKSSPRASFMRSIE